MTSIAPLVPGGRRLGWRLAGAVALVSVGTIACSSTTPATPSTTEIAATAAGSTTLPSATPLTPAAAVALQPALTALAAAEAPGMQPQGSAFAGQFQAGQALEQTINVQPGKCYTIVAASSGVTELDLDLVAAPFPPLPPTVLAKDARTGSEAVIGGIASGCVRNPSPIGGPGKVVVKATSGSGIALAQVFVK